MNGRGAAHAILLGVVCSSVCPTPLRAQSPTDPPNCPPTPLQTQLLRQLRHEEGRPRVFIDEVNFDGAYRFSDSARRELVSDLKKREFFASTEWQDEAAEIAWRAWQDEGYFTAQIQASSRLLWYDAAQQHYALTIKVNEGAQYRLGNLRIVSNTRVSWEDLEQPMLPESAEIGDETAKSRQDPEPPTLRKVQRTEGETAEEDDLDQDLQLADTVFPEEELRQLVHLQSGDLFRVGIIRDALEAMKDLYGTKGYIDFTAAPLTNVDQGHQIINLTLELNEQPQYRLGTVDVVGADPAMEGRIRSVLKAGEVFNGAGIRELLRKEAGLPNGWEARRLDLNRVLATQTVDLRLDLRPCPADSALPGR